MPKRYLVTSALPYASGRLHVGHVAGAYLPADIYVRYLRRCGLDAVYICGSDENGAPITIAAEKEGISPQELVDRFYDLNSTTFGKLGMSFDYYGRTTSEVHAETSRAFFTKLCEGGHIEDKETEQVYCPHCERFLSDRYVEGTCPHCAAAGARGDQCDACGKLVDALKLVDATCKICGRAPEKRRTRHWYLKLDDFEPRLKEWLADKRHWRENVFRFTKNFLDEGLRSRAITRDLDWGIPVPLEEARGKVLYVWFDAPIGYLSFTKEWAAARGEPDAWKPYWCDAGTAIVHFIGKDNVVFHAITWPAMMMGEGSLELPANVVANEFLNIKGRKSSKSRNWAVWVEDALEKFSADQLRYYLCANAPEGRDTDFTWSDFAERANTELADVLGNFVHRALSFLGRYLGGEVPAAGALEERDRAAIEEAARAGVEVGREIEGFHLKAALQRVMRCAKHANQYFDALAPWATRKTDAARTATTLHVSLRLVDALAAMMHPFLPESAARLDAMLGRTEPGAPRVWARIGTEGPQVGEALPAPEPLFRKIEPDEVEAAESALEA